jgi:hypothetical protein
VTFLLDVNLLMALLWENLDEPLARAFAGETGLVALVR